MAHDLAKRLTPAHIGLMTYLPNSIEPSQYNIQIKESAQQGKYSVATRSIGRGDIILKEIPFIRQLRRNLYQSNCYHCFKTITGSSIPCHVKSCLWKLKYCSRVCENKGWHASHSWLCRFPELDDEYYRDVLFALEGYITSRSIGQNVLPEIVSNINLHNPSQLEEYRQKIDSISPLFYLSKRAVESLTIIFCQIRCNSFAVKQAASVSDESLVVSRRSIHLGQAVYLTASKFNHDCDPSALVVFNTNEDPCQLQVQCIKQKIDSGKEVTISYGPLATKHTTKERSEKLRQDYFFDCGCKSCKNESEESLENIYRCQICKIGRLYRYQSKCKDCGQDPYWVHFMKVEAEAEHCIEQNHFLEALQLQEGIYHQNNLKLGQTYDRLAQFYCINNQMSMAAKYSSKSLEVAQHVFGKISVEAAEEMMKLSTLLFNSQQKSVALEQINETMVIYKILGIDKSAPDDIEELENMKHYLTFVAH